MFLMFRSRVQNCELRIEDTVNSQQPISHKHNSVIRTNV